jgi:ABC-type lipoprotein export system ATPase subunit
MGDAVLCADRVSLTYGAGSSPVLRDWSGAFHAGTMTAIVGPSGAGKSSLLFVLGLMLRPDAGEVFVDGEAVSAGSDSRRSALRATRYGFVFQDSCLDPRRSVLDNVLQAAVFRGERRNQRIADAAELLERLGVTVPLDRRPGQVSGGQAQRIALSRALLHDPALILADEPTGNLDPATARVVVAELRARASAGAAVVVVTHSAEVEAACDTALALSPGPVP